MSRDAYEKFTDHSDFTFSEYIESVYAMMSENGIGGRKDLIERMGNPKSDREREFLRIAVKELDDERANRNRVTSNVYFRMREFDR